jgi:aminotransferase
MDRELFSDRAIDRGQLRRKAYNLRWACVEQDVIPLTAADPDFRAPAVVREALAAYVNEGYFSYGPKEGLPEFREAVVDTLRARKGIETRPDLVLPLDSAARAMFVVTRSLLRPGDEAIIFDPVDFLFKQSVEAAGARAVYAKVDTATGDLNLDALESLVTERTKLIGVCNPHNPVGRVLTAKEATAIAEFARRHDLWIMNDEIWSDIVYPGYAYHSLHALPAELRMKTVTVYGFSKSFALAGIRAGFLVCPDRETYDLATRAADIPSTAGGISTLSQVAATAAFRGGWDWVDAFLSHLAELRDYAVDFLASIDGVRCLKPEGTYVLFPDISSFGLSSESLAATLLEKGRVAVVPGSAAFFGPGAEGHIRICFATSRENLEEGLLRVRKTLVPLARRPNACP